ncbi:pld, partial [Symbiodinium pilosum]
EFGPQACMIMVDARSFRDEELFFESFAYNLTMVQEFIKRSYTEDRTMLGRSQLGQLKRDLLACNRAGITWKFLVVSIPMQAMGFPAAQDRWYGYAAERNSLLKFIQDEGIQNVVFLSADIHATFISDVAWQPLGFIPSDPPE